MHDPTQVLMGGALTTDKQVSNFEASPATFPAGTAVRVNSAGALSVTKAHGQWAGISAGKSLSDILKTAVIRCGEKIPIKMTDLSAYASLVVGDLTFTAKAKDASGDDITITLANTKSDGSAAVAVTGTDIVIAMQNGVTTAATIKTAFDASAAAVALAGVAIAEGKTTTAQDAATEDNLDGGRDPVDYIVLGAKVYIDDVTGLANDSNESNTTISDAVYVSGLLTGINEDGTTCYAALVDMPGGL